MGSVD